MTHVSNREIASMSAEALADRLEELQEELLQLRAEQALGGTHLIWVRSKQHAARLHELRQRWRHSDTNQIRIKEVNENGCYLQRMWTT